jgi:hypothetical protein
MLTGTGVKIKIIEAMAHKLPVVCNERGLDGMPLKINNGCMVTSSPDRFATCITDFLSDKMLYDLKSTQARLCYEHAFTREIGYQKLDEAIEKAKK